MKLFIVLIAIVSTITSCNSEYSNVEILQIRVDSKREICGQEPRRFCMLVKESLAESYSTVSSDIVGFKYDIGYTYDLLVEVSGRAEKSYKLVDILAKEEDRPSTTYTYLLTRSDVNAFSTDEDPNRSYLYNQEFVCSAICIYHYDAINEIDDDQMLRVVFYYLGSSVMELIETEVVDS